MERSKIFVILKEGEELEPYIEYLKELQEIFNRDILFLIVQNRYIQNFLEKSFFNRFRNNRREQEYTANQLEDFLKSSKGYFKMLKQILSDHGIEKVEFLLISKDLIRETKNLLEKEFRVELMVIFPEIRKYFFKNKKNIWKIVEEFKVSLLTLSPKKIL